MTLHPTGKATASAIPPSTSEASSRVTPPTHVFIQGGVGGLAAAVIGHFWERLGARRPVAVIVEPEEADGLLCSARAGRPVASGGNLDTVMAGLLGLIEVARDEERRREIGLDERSRVLVFNTEGATDPELYGRIVGGGDSFRGDSRHR
ncbi:MAG: pyridoxal-phosphate dependent enzyme [Gemmatimonadetes bacterium]|nr:pyridoxal-phosphate dependent enzyme [Gemmatimonadota bacterium]